MDRNHSLCIQRHESDILLEDQPGVEHKDQGLYLLDDFSSGAEVKVSIVVPLYNYAQYVGHCIDSCLRQDFKDDYEIIVVDDGSTDQSVLKVMEFQQSSRVKLIRHKGNKGYSVAKNTGIIASSGEYVALIDADDMLTVNSIRTRAAFLDQHKAFDFVHGYAFSIIGDGGYDYWEHRIYKLKLCHQPKKIHSQTVMVRRSVYEKYGLYDEDLRSKSDNEMWYRLMMVAQLNHWKLDVPPLAFYRRHDLSMIMYRKRNPDYSNAQLLICDKKKALRTQEGITRENTRFI
jgi:glycosyltransferase involved in cell wall biosynthesis